MGESARGHLSTLTAEVVADLTATSRAKQGLRPTIDDAPTLDKIAGLLLDGKSPRTRLSTTVDNPKPEKCEGRAHHSAAHAHREVRHVAVEPTD